MNETWLHQLEAWREFYLLVGTAGAALVGLMFVVVSLGPQTITRTQSGVRAFCTPIIIDFTTALVISGLMMAQGLVPLLLALVLGAIGAGGLVYQLSIRTHAQWRENRLPGIDWVWFVGLPLAAFAIILTAAIGIWQQSVLGLYGVAIAAFLFVIIGIRNAWDVVLWTATQPRS